MDEFKIQAIEWEPFKEIRDCPIKALADSLQFG